MEPGAVDFPHVVAREMVQGGRKKSCSVLFRKSTLILVAGRDFPELARASNEGNDARCFPLTNGWLLINFPRVI